MPPNGIGPSVEVSSASTDSWAARPTQWYPDLVYDNHPVEAPATPEEGYHLSKDIADKTIEFIRDAKVIAPDKAWFSYVCPGAGHAPHHVFKEWADKYTGTFDMGYEPYRDIVLENQKTLGIVPPDTELSPVNPYLDVKGPNGEPWPLQDTVRPRDSLNDEEKRLLLPHGRGVRRIPQLHRTRSAASWTTWRSRASSTTPSSW